MGQIRTYFEIFLAESCSLFPGLVHGNQRVILEPLPGTSIHQRHLYNLGHSWFHHAGCWALGTEEQQGPFWTEILCLLHISAYYVQHWKVRQIQTIWICNSVMKKLKPLHIERDYDFAKQLPIWRCSCTIHVLAASRNLYHHQESTRNLPGIYQTISVWYLSFCRQKRLPGLDPEYIDPVAVTRKVIEGAMGFVWAVGGNIPRKSGGNS